MTTMSRARAWADRTCRRIAGRRKLLVALLAGVGSMSIAAAADPAAAPTANASAVIEAFGVDENLYVSVNGIPAGSLKWGVPVAGQGGQGVIDVTPWLRAGGNDIGVYATNGGGPAGFSYTFKVDGVTVASADCSQFATCAPPAGTALNGLTHQATYRVNSATARAKQVTVSGHRGASIYIDGRPTVFTTPATLSLAAGPHDIAVGKGSESAVPGGQFVYTGAFYEKRVDVQSDLSVSLNDVPPKASKPWKLAILPVRTTYHGDPNDPRNRGYLSDADIAYGDSRTRATGTRLALPFSYGLIEWQVTLLPVVEDTPLYRDASADNPDGSIPDTDRMLQESGLAGTLDGYDTVMYLYSTHQENGEPVPYGPCCGWGGVKQMWITDSFIGSGMPPDAHVEGLLHEWLHGVEWYQASVHGERVTIGGLHAAESHGYLSDPDPGRDWERWYRSFMRAQVVETLDMTSLAPRADKPSRASKRFLAGVFETMYGGPTVLNSAQREAAEQVAPAP